MNKRKFATSFGVLSIVSLVYCLMAFLYIQPRLTPAMQVPSETIRMLGNWCIPAYILVGISHLILLVNRLNNLTVLKSVSFFQSFFIVIIILSGITLLSDATLLSDIGKEYLHWDVGAQWTMLYGFVALHLFVVILGTIQLYRNRANGQSLFQTIRNGSDVLFVTMHQISLISAIIGIAGLVLSRISGVGKEFQTTYMILLSCLAVLPLVSFSFYWMIKNRNKKLSTWFDEKQMADSSMSALVSLSIAFPLIILAILFSILFDVFSASFWLILVFFITLGIFSGSIVIRNRM